jgi:hypothetical protein
MVTVISTGIKTCTCGKCKSKLEYCQNEVQEYKINWDYLGDYDVVRGIECPVCKTVIRDK